MIFGIGTTEFWPCTYGTWPPRKAGLVFPMFKFRMSETSPMMRFARALILLSFAVTVNAFATIYYVDYTHGSDSNSGTSKTAPFRYPPGSNSCTHACAAMNLNPGDSVIFKGCVSWMNETFPIRPKWNGANGNPIYYGVDQSWWDNTVSGCSGSWNRPIMNAQGQTTDPNSTGVEILFDNRGASYITWDNLEVVNWYTYPDTSSGSHEAVVWHVSSSNSGAHNNTISNNYVHGWINPAFSVGTGNITSGSCVITNFVPYSYSPPPSSSWTSIPGSVQVQSLPQGSNLPEGNNTPTVTAISGSNPYTITFTNSSGCPSSSVTGAVIQVGIDVGVIVSGNSAGDPGTVVTNNVFDGSDVAVVGYNPYGDCGASEGNNNVCAASVEVGRQGPQIWRNNVMRYVSNGFVGSSSEMSGNLLEYFRLGTDPTGHTNVWEDQPCLGATCLYYGNLIRHMNSVNSSIPGGFWNIGEPIAMAPTSGNTTWAFNNVAYDMTQNTVWELNTDCGGCGSGTVNFFNNTTEGGPDAGPSFSIFSCTVTTCLVQNNHAITSSSNPFGSCGGGCAKTTNLAMSQATANADGYTSGQPYSFSPIASNSPTVAAGTNAGSLCAALSGFNSAAGTACQNDTPYAVGYDNSNHTVIIPDRSPNPRSPSGAWDVGGYEFSSNGNAPQPPTGLSAIIN
jgi:hypothetical protein